MESVEKTEKKEEEEKPINIVEVEREEKDHYDLIVKQPSHIKKKIEYNAFLRALKKKNFTTAILMAKALRVSPNTIENWLKTPKAVKIVQEDIEYYIDRIRKSNDWEASKYLLDKIVPQDIPISQSNTLVGLNIIIKEEKKE